MGRYVLRRLLNYAVLLVVAVSLTYLLAATQLNPRSLYEVRNPPLDPVVVEADPAGQEPQRPVPLLQRYWTWLTDIVLTGTGASPRRRERQRGGRADASG